MKTNTPPRRRPQRSADNDTLTFSLPRELRQAIDENAKGEGRNKSEWLRVNLAKIVGVQLSR